MFDKQSFLTCIAQNLGHQGFGKKRTEEVQQNFLGLLEQFTEAGDMPGDAANKATRAVLDNLAYEMKEKAKRAMKAVEVQAFAKQRLESAGNILVGLRGLVGNENVSDGAKLGIAVNSILSQDARFKGASVEASVQAYRDKYLSLMNDAIEQYGRGALGRRKGEIKSLDNVVSELFGEDTGDAAAKNFADTYRKINDMGVDDFNAAGGSMRKRGDYNISQRQNNAKVVEAQLGPWSEKMNGWLDWSRMTWPDGAPIKAAERKEFLREVYETLRTDGANKIEPGAMKGRGAAVGNALDQHRLLVYKNADSWRAMNAEFGDGANPFDLIISHISQMAHRNGLVNVLGPNPQMAFDAIKNQARSMAASAAQTGKNKTVLTDLEGALKNRSDPMFEVLTRQNAVDPNSKTGAIVSATSQILASAQLGSAAIAATIGDMFTSAVTKGLESRGNGIFGMLGHYVEGMASNPAEFRRMSGQAGFVYDNLVSNILAVQRFSGITTHGPAIARTVADSVMRATLMSKHTDVLRASFRMETMGFMERSMGQEWEANVMNRVMARYGITKADYDAIRSVAASELRPGAKFLTPMDVLNSKLPNKDELFRKYHAFIDNESRIGVPGTSLEATVMLKGTTRPDTMVGILTTSFGAYKNFPVSMPMIYGRQLLAQEGSSGPSRLLYAAAVGMGLTATGALIVQLRNVAQGKEPQPMDARFFGKAALSGGALSIFGDFLFAGVNEQGNNVAGAIAGPGAGLVQDVSTLLLGDAFGVLSAMDKTKDYDSKFGSRAVDFAKRYTPGTSIWYARLALERTLWDNLDEFVDPRTARAKQQRKMQKLRNDYGTSYWWRPGDASPR